MAQNLQNEYIPYDTNNVRRSTRQRSAVRHYVPEKAPRLSVERTPVQKRVRRTRSRSTARSIEHYTNDNEDSFPAAVTTFNDNMRAQNFQGGFFRPPLRKEACDISLHATGFRNLENELIKKIKEMLEAKNDPTLDKYIEVLDNVIEVVDWEMDERNVQKTDLPDIETATTFADISTWLIYFFNRIHDNFHRIIDVMVSSKPVLVKNEFKTLFKEYDEKALRALDEFADFVKTLKLEGHSLNVYKETHNNVIQKCGKQCPVNKI